MKKFMVCCFVLLCVNISYSQNKLENWFEINAFNKNISFSRISKPGRISVFLVSTWWCPPCKVLYKDFKQVSNNHPYVDFYYVDMSSDNTGNRDPREIKNTHAYRQWRFYERLAEWPTIYITAPNTNVVSKFSPLVLKEGREGWTMFEKTMNVIAKLEKELRQQGYEGNLIASHQDFFLEGASKIPILADKGRDLCHKVKRGETLYKIAVEYEVTVQQIMKWNDLKNEKIRIGKMLYIK